MVKSYENQNDKKSRNNDYWKRLLENLGYSRWWKCLANIPRKIRKFRHFKRYHKQRCEQRNRKFTIYGILKEQKF